MTGTCLCNNETGNCRNLYQWCRMSQPILFLWFSQILSAVLFGAMIQTGNKRHLVSPERDPGVRMRWFKCVLWRTLVWLRRRLATTSSFCLADPAIEVSASKSVCHIRQTLSKHSGPCFLLLEETLALRHLVSPERDPGVGMGELVVKCILQRTLALPAHSHMKMTSSNSFSQWSLCCKSVCPFTFVTHFHTRVVLIYAHWGDTCIETPSESWEGPWCRNASLWWYLIWLLLVGSWLKVSKSEETHCHNFNTAWVAVAVAWKLIKGL